MHAEYKDTRKIKIWTASKTVVRLRANGKHVKEGQKIYIHEFCDHVTLNNPMAFNVMTQKCTKPQKTFSAVTMATMTPPIPKTNGFFTIP